MTFRQKAIQAISTHHALLVFPLNNRKDIASIWSALHPKSKMRWEWDENGDDRVWKLWILREELSRSNEVVYTKWFQNRATFFSREIFVLLLAYFQTPQKTHQTLSRDSQNIMEALEMDSPLSTKQLKIAANPQGRSLEGHYNKAMKPLWQNFWIVGFGEIQDSSFPSLAVGATRTLFEDLWLEASQISSDQAEKRLNQMMGLENIFWKYARKIRLQTTK